MLGTYVTPASDILAVNMCVLMLAAAQVSAMWMFIRCHALGRSAIWMATCDSLFQMSIHSSTVSAALRYVMCLSCNPFSKPVPPCLVDAISWMGIAAAVWNLNMWSG
ncbi:hypothetical protein COO60DRAFT_1700508 [Scenedesmus sp. NREL 46B-D3]|nr:hypothetical protein COO60DRAFT_1700508 [Scenedesmus sp. NREL 46B-D3]